MTDRTTLAPFVSLRQAMDELFNESFTGTPTAPCGPATARRYTRCP